MNRPDVRAVAQGKWPGILLSMGLDDKALSGKHGPCPLCGGKDRFRFDDKDGRGTYFCSQCGPGDGVQLAMGITSLDFREAAQEIERLAGAAPLAPRMAEQSPQDRRKALRTVWNGSRPIHGGDEAHRYLRGRGLALDTLPAALRLHPGLRYFDEGTKAVLGTYPAMVARVTAPDGNGASIHRTFLHDGKKAPVPQPRKMMPVALPLAGAAVRLFPSGGRLGIAEGIETALAASELFGLPVWSCVDAAGIAAFLPPPGVRELMIFADNDENFTGQQAAFTAARRLRAKGLKLDVHIPPTTGADWLDVLADRKAANAP